MYLRVACVLIAAMALCCVSSVSARQPGGGLLGLTLPSFPLPPKADRAMLHIRETNADADFESDVTPRFQSVDDSEEDGAEVEADADAEEQTEETETETETEEEQVEEDAEAEAETEAEEEQPAVVVPQMRFRSMQQRQRYDANALPAGPMPVQPASQWDAYARARVNPASIGEPAFQPIHNSERQFVGAYPARSLAATPNGYAWAAARPAPANYQFGNLIGGVPVNANVGALYPRAPVPTPAPAPMPAATSFMEANARVNAGAGAGAALYRPYAPGMAPANTPSRSASADLYASSYKSYSSANWPSSVPPPAAYYLPPDVVV